MRKLLKEWREELIGVPIAFILLLFIAPPILRWVDPTAAVYDAGVLQMIFLAAVFLLVFNALAWIGVKIMFPEIFNWFQKSFSTEYKEITAWQRVKISFCLYLGLLLAFILLARVI